MQDKVFLLFFFFFFTLGNHLLWVRSLKADFTFHLGSVHPLQDVSLHQRLPLSSSCCFPVPSGSSFLAVSSCHLLLGCPHDLFPLLGCHSVQHLVYLLSFIFAICLAYLHLSFSVYSLMSIIFVLFMISEHSI